ncbi:hypothetical protein KSP39_PZI000315 [Platanthera zijinensis]|uniref:Uncharacterized protein n=1 Tax=Platanthera zijinensis TaxID=2320716 RepID=A0AAP0C4G5_9ASPA
MRLQPNDICIIGKSSDHKVKSHLFSSKMTMPFSCMKSCEKLKRSKYFSLYFEERIRRMQSVFNRERSKHKKTNESWQDQASGTYQQSPRNDWYWEADASFRDRTNFKATPRSAKPSGKYMWSHHYAILGLDSPSITFPLISFYNLLMSLLCRNICRRLTQTDLSSS